MPVPGKIDIVSLAVVYWITFVSEAARGLVMPSTWPYFSSAGGSKAMLGVFVGVLSFGRMLVTIPLGYLSDKCSSTEIFYLSAVIQIIGHVMYCLFPYAKALIISRLVVGLGSSTLSVCRAYITKSVPSEQRTHHFAYLSALQFIGFAVSPGVGSALTYLPKGSFLGLPLNAFTYPAVLLVIFCALIVVTTYLFYEDPQPLPPSDNQNTRKQPQEQERSASARADYGALLVCVLANMVFRGLIAELETVTTPFMMEQYGITFTSAGSYLTAFGLFGLLVYTLFKPLARAMSDRKLIALGLAIILLCTLPLCFSLISSALPLLVYAVLIGALWAVAYPIGQTGALALFSKVMRTLPPGGLLGIFSATGSGARIGFAVAAGALWSAAGREAVFYSIVGCTVACALMVGVTWRRLAA